MISEHRGWLRNAVRASYRGETGQDSLQKKATRALNEESRNDIALTYQSPHVLRQVGQSSRVTATSS